MCVILKLIDQMTLSFTSRANIDSKIEWKWNQNRAFFTESLDFIASFSMKITPKAY